MAVLLFVLALFAYDLVVFNESGVIYSVLQYMASEVPH